MSAFFQLYINKVLAEYLNIFYIVYFNDILIYSDNVEKHEKYI